LRTLLVLDDLDRQSGRPRPGEDVDPGGLHRRPGLVRMLARRDCAPFVLDDHASLARGNAAGPS
jgi:hypothetical protein